MERCVRLGKCQLWTTALYLIFFIRCSFVLHPFLVSRVFPPRHHGVSEILRDLHGDARPGEAREDVGEEGEDSRRTPTAARLTADARTARSAVFYLRDWTRRWMKNGVLISGVCTDASCLLVCVTTELGNWCTYWFSLAILTLENYVCKFHCCNCALYYKTMTYDAIARTLSPMQR